MNNFIPVEARTQGRIEFWHIDVSKLKLNELIALKKELEGNKADSVSALDAIIHQSIGYNVDELKMSRRETKKTNRSYKRRKALIKNNKRKGR